MEPLVSGAGELGIRLDRAQLRQFRQCYDEVTEWNRRANLTAVTGLQEFQTRHFLDSLTVSSAVGHGRLETGRVLDVGSGAGFPGLPLKIAFPKLNVTLLDATAKKTAFLDHLVGALGLDGVQVLTGRAEALAHDPALREAFDIVLSRALARLSTLAELTLPFCKQGGLVVAHKGASVAEELSEAENAIKLVGGGLKTVKEVSYEGSGGDSVLVVLEKLSPTPARYPRRPGMPSKRPL